MERTAKKNELRQCFEIAIDGKIALLAYEQRGEDLLAFTHTFVPEELRGQNLAALLTKAALDDARRQGKKVIPQCSYVATYMERNKDYADLRAEADLRL